MPKTFYKLGLVIAIVPLVISLVIFPFLPGTIPTHFWGGDPNTWSDKWSASGIAALFMIPVLSLVIFGLLYGLAPILREAAKAGDPTLRTFSKKKWEIFVLFTAAFIAAVHIWCIGLLLSNV
jgi:uncharacterized membrane protein